MSKKLLCPDDIRDFLTRRFNNQHQNWLRGEGSWPLSVPLGVPTERDVTQDAEAVRAWVGAWAACSGLGELLWEERQWGRLGAHRLPSSVVVSTPLQVAAIARQGARWTLATRRYDRLNQRWPELAASTVLARNFDVLADYEAVDFERLFGLLEWLDVNPASGKYLRQLPVEGLDTKWIEKRRGLVMDLVHALRGAEIGRDFYALCGLQRPLHRLRIRLLCPVLRAAVGGLRDIEAPVDELAALRIAPGAAVIVENLETGVALPDFPGCVALMKLGNAVSVLQDLPWLRDIPAVYWGDIDTHGLAILSRARRQLPRLKSVLMDPQTLLAHRPLWGQESAQHIDAVLADLTPAERAVFDGLKGNVWGHKVRLEQERLPWDAAMQAVREALACMAGATAPSLSAPAS